MPSQSTIIGNTEPTAKVSVIDQLYSKLTAIKDKIKEGGLSSTLFNELTQQAKLIQDKLNKLLGNKFIITQTDVDDAYATLQEVQRREMKALERKATRNAIIYGVVIIGVVIGAYVLLKPKK